jgi:hypothetical protein
MKVFWLVVGGLVVGSIVAVDLALSGLRGVALTLFQKLVCYAAGGTLVGIVWAILFRSQIEKFRLSLFALFVLVLAEAMFLLAVRIANPFWAL